MSTPSGGMHVLDTIDKETLQEVSNSLRGKKESIKRTNPLKKKTMMRKKRNENTLVSVTKTLDFV